MTWRSPPQELVTLRTMLASVTAWTAAGGAQAQIHYPFPAESAVYPRLVLFSDLRRDDVATGVTLRRGSIEMQLEAYGRWSDSITAVDTGAGTVTVAGDISAQVAVDDEVRIQGSTGNDNWCRVTGVSVAAGDTTITLETGTTPALPDATVDGALLTGSVEDLADLIAEGLLGLQTGLPLRDGGRDGAALFPEASDADPVITANITLTTGLDT